MFIRQSLRSGQESADHVRMKFGSRELSISIDAVFQWIVQVNLYVLHFENGSNDCIGIFNENA